jgi:hypothetical protein
LGKFVGIYANGSLLLVSGAAAHFVNLDKVLR